ncbi:DUF3320 domain-containing protein [Corynebacterium sp. AOP40-9SA-29]|uniref:DUF3320 domain-containing protein n=1 Tax=Corynebacterium sp. AOP40-9SA-29 TaxID=3457677 RepID=UPI004034487C
MTVGQRDEVSAALSTWRDGLVGLTKGSPMMQFKAPKSSSLRIDAGGPGGSDELLARMRSGKSFQVEGAGDVDEPRVTEGDSIRAVGTETQVGATLRNLMRKANDEYLNRGVDVVYMAFGALVWEDVDGTELTSPLLFVPVKLTSAGARKTPKLAVGEGDTVLNPALVLQLSRLGVQIRGNGSELEEIEDPSVSEVLSQVRNALGGSGVIETWRVDDIVHLGVFTFEKEAMYKDLLEHEEENLEHPIVRALGTSDPLKQTRDFAFDAIDPADIDEQASPEDVPLLLDADSSQRAAIAAAVAGKSFVMDGPPGTGKSQTITNMIGTLLHAGQTVLFVSEKIAALDVVKNRLSDAGLGSYVLELHSHKTKRKDVATELLSALDKVARPPEPISQATRQRALEHRVGLNDYARAMNEKRAPLNMSLHEVVGRHAQLNGDEGVPAPAGSLKGLKEKDLDDAQQALSQVVAAWRPALQGTSYIWRDVIENKSMKSELVRAKEAITQLRQALGVHGDLARAFSLTKPSDTPVLLSYLRHIQKPHSAEIPDSWITQESLVGLQEARDQLGREIAAVSHAVGELEELSGVGRSAFPASGSFPDGPPPINVRPRPIAFETRTCSDLRNLAKKFEEQSSSLVENAQVIQEISSKLDGPTAENFDQVESFIRLIHLADEERRPLRQWLSSPNLRIVREHVTAVKSAVGALVHAETSAAPIYTAEALAEPLEELNDRFTNLHRGLRKLSGQYRADKRTLARVMVDAAQVKDGIASLDKAVTWSSAHGAYLEATERSTEILGEYWQGRDTDFAAIDAALRVADEAILLSDGIVSTKMANYLTSPAKDSTFRGLADSAAGEIRSWKEATFADTSGDIPSELVLGKVIEAASWLDAHVRPFGDAAERVESVTSVTSTDLSVQDVEVVVTALELVEMAEAVLETSNAGYREVIGEFANGLSTDLKELDHNIDWVVRLRRINGGALSEAQNSALRGAIEETAVHTLYDRWTTDLDRVLRAFSQERRVELAEELDDFDVAPDYLAALQEDNSGQREWFSYSRARTNLGFLGLKDAIDFCIDRKLDAGVVSDTVMRSLLRGWVDEVLDTDGRLRPLGSADHDNQVIEFQGVDRRLSEAAVSDIITAANARRPVNTEIGEPGIIRREGGKQRRHMSVQDLLAKTRTVTPSIKPIFMMSPMAVSQYLPHDLHFDVVIFDEASQVTPADAINSVYRGNSLILAGDDKQLPPMSFFARNVDSDEEDPDTDVSDFPSILELAKSAGAFKNLGLKWHYRSRHEDLIAFSNYKFYEGSLVTFPSSQTDGEDVGVEFIHAGGTYRRGAGRDNRIEAEKVAERVFHHYSTRPESTLGVVTFSAPQAEAVRLAIEEKRRDRPDLDSYFDTNDRLGGFFIRPLEQVQGDERDVIIFSVGYGPDEAGKISANFGALNKEKGWRRLNVGITRAKSRIEVIASMRAEEIPPSKNENVEYFRAYLDYAVKGPQTLAVPYSSTGLEPDSVFEESVIEAIQRWGYIVEPQVGAAGYRIDIGVRHPKHEGMFVLGVECDGYQYHSAPAARDRDRLRENVLVNLGWSLHRIWGTAWYRDQKAEEARLRKAIEHAVAQGTETIERARPEITFPTVELQAAPVSMERDWTTDYKMAESHGFPVWVGPGDEGSHIQMVDSIEALVREEGPIHIEVVYERLRDWWSIGRIGAKIKANIERAIRIAEVSLDGGFLVNGDPVSFARMPADGVQRKAEHIHLDEVAVAVAGTIGDAGAASRDEVVQNVARTFGWSRTGGIVSRSIGDAIIELVRTGALIEKESMLSRA